MSPVFVQILKEDDSRADYDYMLDNPGEPSLLFLLVLHIISGAQCNTFC